MCARHHARNLRLIRTYGITLRDTWEIYLAQDGLCPVCCRVLGDDWVVDHDHPARKVRGLLCLYCNHRVVGRHRDGDLLIRAGEYLKDPPAARVIGEEPTVPVRARKRKPKRKK